MELVGEDDRVLEEEVCLRLDGIYRDAQQERPVASGSPVQRLTQALGGTFDVARTGPPTRPGYGDKVRVPRGGGLATGGQVDAVVEHTQHQVARLQVANGRQG